MVKSGYSELLNWLTTMFLGVVVSQNIVNISGTVASLTLSDSECSFSVSNWQITHASVVLFLFILSTCYRFIGISLWVLWNLVWCILGMVWLLNDSTCKDKNESAFTSSFIMATLSLVLLLLIVILFSISVVAFCIGYGLSNRYTEIDS